MSWAMRHILRPYSKKSPFTEPSKYDTSYLGEIFELHLKTSFSFLDHVHACVEKTDKQRVILGSKFFQEKNSCFGEGEKEEPTSYLSELLQCVLWHFQGWLEEQRGIIIKAIEKIIYVKVWGVFIWIYIHYLKLLISFVNGRSDVLDSFLAGTIFVTKTFHTHQW